MPVVITGSDVAPVTSHERDTAWPDSMEIVATFTRTSTNGQIIISTDVRSVTITREQFFGLGDHGAPISGEWLVAALDRLRKPPK